MFGLKLPHLIVVLRNRTIRREKSRFADIDQHLLRPFAAVFVLLQRFFLLFCIRFKIKQRHKPVFFQQFIVKARQIFFPADLKHLIADNKINGPLNILVFLIVIFGYIIRFFIMFNYGIAGFSENIYIILSNQFRYLYVCAIHGAKRNRAV